MYKASFKYPFIPGGGMCMYLSYKVINSKPARVREMTLNIQ